MYVVIFNEIIIGFISLFWELSRYPNPRSW